VRYLNTLRKKKNILKQVKHFWQTVVSGTAVTFLML